MSTLSPKGRAQRAYCLQRAKARLRDARKELATVLRDVRAVAARAVEGTATSNEVRDSGWSVQRALCSANDAAKHVAQIESGIYSEGWV